MVSSIPSNANGESPVPPIAIVREGQLAAQIRPRTVEDVVGMTVPVKGIIMDMSMAIVVGVGVRHSGSCASWRMTKW